MDEKEELEYHCLMCGTKFKRFIGSTTGHGDGKHQKTSDQVPCENPSCSHVLKTWSGE